METSETDTRLTIRDRVSIALGNAIVYGGGVAILCAGVFALETFAGIKVRGDAPFRWGESALLIAGVAVYFWLIFQSQRITKLEDENKKQAHINKDLRYRLKKLEDGSFSMDRFVRGMHPNWQYQALRERLADERLSGQYLQELNRQASSGPAPRGTDPALDGVGDSASKIDR